MCSMFCSYKRLQKRTTAKDLNRCDYLQALVTEFQDSNNTDAKEQVLANLANFAYDPINFQHLRDLHVIDMFIDCIDNKEDINGNTVQYSIGGLCNLSADAENRQIIVENPYAIEYTIKCLSSLVEETVISAITLLIQLIVPSSRPRIVTAPVIECMQRFASMSNVRYKNPSLVFLEDYCTSEERACAVSTSTGKFLYIPVPE